MLAGHYGFGRSDQEDIEQELTIEVWRRLPEFNPTRGSLEAFV
jgi:DNA-directed RNA polymerase specialized sigma24 family protein